MKKIPIQDIEDGMILAKPLLGADGKILMAQGVTLKATMASRLKNWGVVLAHIKQEGVVTDSSDSDEKVELLEIIEKKFEDVLNDSNMKVLYNAVTKHIKENH